MLSQGPTRGLPSYLTTQVKNNSELRDIMFDYSDASKFAHIQAHLGHDRLTHYMTATAGDIRRAIALYVWNTTVSAAFYGSLQALEVGLRNGMHVALSNSYGATWHDNQSFLALDSTGGLSKDIQDAKDELLGRNQVQDTPHIVAQLHFGFWTQLTSSRFETDLWLPCLQAAFANYILVEGRPLRRNVVARNLIRIRMLRNRIAHHERIFHYDLQLRYEEILSVCAWMYDDLRDWIEHHFSIRTNLSQRPC